MGTAKMNTADVATVVKIEDMEDMNIGFLVVSMVVKQEDSGDFGRDKKRGIEMGWVVDMDRGNDTVDYCYLTTKIDFDMHSGVGRNC
jgi:hypothetical protein